MYDLRIPISKDGKVVPLDIQKRQNDILPTILEHELDPPLDAILVDRIRAVDQREKDIVPQSLESGNGEGLCGEEGGERVGGCDTESQDLPVVEHLSVHGTHPSSETGSPVMPYPSRSTR